MVALCLLFDSAEAKGLWVIGRIREFYGFCASANKDRSPGEPDLVRVMEVLVPMR
jgi:hypothetical protein